MNNEKRLRYVENLMAEWMSGTPKDMSEIGSAIWWLIEQVKEYHDEADEFRRKDNAKDKP